MFCLLGSDRLFGDEVIVYDTDDGAVEVINIDDIRDFLKSGGRFGNIKSFTFRPYKNYGCLMEVKVSDLPSSEKNISYDGEILFVDSIPRLSIREDDFEDGFTHYFYCENGLGLYLSNTCYMILHNNVLHKFTVKGARFTSSNLRSSTHDFKTVACLKINYRTLYDTECIWLKFDKSKVIVGGTSKESIYSTMRCNEKQFKRMCLLSGK